MIRIRTLLFKITFGFILAGIPVAGYGQLILGAKGMAMGQTATALPDYEWSVFANPALISQQQRTVGFYGLRNYGFAEITDIGSFASQPTAVGVFALGFHRYGDHLFNETRLRAAYKNHWRNLHFGVVVNYNHIAFGGVYGSGGAIGFDAGLASEITNGLWFGARATNLNMPHYTGLDEELPRELAVGMSYQLNAAALFSFDVVKDVRFPVSYRGGLEIRVIEDLKGRVGISTEPQTYSFGLGYGKALWQVNLVVQKHAFLGFSPGMDLMVFF